MKEHKLTSSEELGGSNAMRGPGHIEEIVQICCDDRISDRLFSEIFRNIWGARKLYRLKGSRAKSRVACCSPERLSSPTASALKFLVAETTASSTSTGFSSSSPVIGVRLRYPTFGRSRLSQYKMRNRGIRIVPETERILP